MPARPLVNERRRSDRLLLTIPLMIQATPADAGTVEKARTVSVNRHGARIQISGSVRVGQIVRIVNQVSQRSADFRVVGPVSPPTELSSEWGVECLTRTDIIWGIKFPPPPKDGAPGALLECRKCHTVALLPLSLVEVEVLETAGIIAKRCDSCATDSPWGFTEKQVAMDAPPEEAAMIAEAGAEPAEKGSDRRRYRRVCLQLPALVRDYYGGVEITRTENVSMGGFCFASDKNYFVGQGILAVCPYNDAGHNIDVPARLVRRREWEAAQRKLYGVRYDPQ